MTDPINSNFLIQMYLAIMEEIKKPNLTVEYIRVHTLDEPDTITCSFYSSIEGTGEEYERHDIVFSTKSYYYYGISFDDPVLISDFIMVSDAINKNTPNLDEKVALILLYGAKDYPIDDSYFGALEDMVDYADMKYSSIYRNVLDIQSKDAKRIAEKEGIQIDNLINEVRSTTQSITMVNTKDNNVSISITTRQTSDMKPCDKLTSGLILRYVIGYIKLKYLSYRNDISSFDCVYYKDTNTLGVERSKFTL